MHPVHVAEQTLLHSPPTVVNYTMELNTCSTMRFCREEQELKGLTARGEN